MRIEVVQNSACFSDLQDPWTNLVRDATNATPFQTWEWHKTWFDVYGRSKRPFILSAWEGDDLVGIFPLARKAGAWSVLRSSGTGPSDYLHPLIRTGYEAQVESAFSESLASQNDYSLIDLHQVGSRSSLSPEGSIELEQATCLMLDLPENFESYLGMLGKSLRYDVRKLEKSLFTEGRAKIEWTTEESLPLGLEILFEQHRKRWRKRMLPGAFIGKAQSFHHAWGKLAIKQDWLRVGILYLDGNPSGAIYGMAMGDAVFFYQAGFDPVYKAVSPGTLLVGNFIRRSIEEGRKEFDFLRGDEPYKRRWKPQRSYVNRRLIIPRKTPLGALGAKWNLLGSRVEGKIRERLEGKSLV
jgi:CelD/BcsL family acetyltransferase involved in cellulose biosynthesis